jgi:hypothetical protein
MRSFSSPTRFAACVRIASPFSLWSSSHAASVFSFLDCPFLRTSRRASSSASASNVGPGDHPAYIPSELAVEELFTASEAEAVAEFLRRHTVYAGVTVKPVTLLIPNTWKCLVVLPAPIDDDYDPGNALVILDRRLPFSINGYVNERVAPVDHAIWAGIHRIVRR